MRERFHQPSRDHVIRDTDNGMPRITACRARNGVTAEQKITSGGDLAMAATISGS